LVFGLGDVISSCGGLKEGARNIMFGIGVHFGGVVCSNTFFGIMDSGDFGRSFVGSFSEKEKFHG
jgi:hypothetical protein